LFSLKTDLEHGARPVRQDGNHVRRAALAILPHGHDVGSRQIEQALDQPPIPVR
jgi:hypothetical protein